ncbi:MAG: hypothetical protein Q8L35_00080 [Actinomycetota bacterium]|nr:hypothetical protein [Actinomycetota bacterium]
MRQTALYFLLIVFILILLIVPAVAMAESMPGMPMEETQTGAAKDTNSADHKPPEQRADDSTMAAVVSGIFGLPVAAWFITRSVRKAKKNST